MNTISLSPHYSRSVDNAGYVNDKLDKPVYTQKHSAY